MLPLAVGVLVYNMEQADSLLARVLPGTLADITAAYHILGFRVVQVNFALAAFTTLLATSLGSKSGFPLSFEFRLPISTHMLVAVPMLFMVVLCASLYVVPVLLGRLLYGVPFPMLHVSAVLGTLVIILLTSTWTMGSALARIAAVLVAIAVSLQLYRSLAPFHAPTFIPGTPLIFTPDYFSLTAMDYLLLASVCFLLCVLTLASIRKQRCGEDPMMPAVEIPQARQQEMPERSIVTHPLSLTALQDRLVAMFPLPCPVQAPWRAELWLELRLNGLPILLFSVVMALFVPVLLLVSFSGSIGRLDYFFPLAILLTGIGYATFKRRLASAGYMSAFEGTRGMGTAQLALIQLLAIGAICLCGMFLVCASLYLWWPEFLVGALSKQLQDFPDALRERSLVLLLNDAVAFLVLYLSIIAAFVCVHICSLIWGWMFPFGAVLLIFYGFNFAVYVNRGASYAPEPESIKLHMWGVAAAVLLVTLMALGRTLYLKLLSLRVGLAALLCWAAFLACSVYSLSQRNIDLPNEAPELQAFNAALLMLPLTLFIVLLWAYDKLRHR